MLKVQELFYRQDLPDIQFDLPTLEYKVLLLQNNVFFCIESQIGYRFSIDLNYTFGNNRLTLVHREGQYISNSTSLVLRRIVNFTPSGYLAITLLCLNYLIRSELKIQAFGRRQIESLDLRISGRTTMLLPLITFIDTFGLYRNSYRSLIGIYFIIVAMNSRERNRRANMFPLTLSLHSSNFADVVDTVRLLASLDRGIEVLILGQGIVLLVAFILAFLSNMP